MSQVPTVRRHLTLTALESLVKRVWPCRLAATCSPAQLLFTIPPSMTCRPATGLMDSISLSNKRSIMRIRSDRGFVLLSLLRNKMESLTRREQKAVLKFTNVSNLFSVSGLIKIYVMMVNIFSKFGANVLPEMRRVWVLSLVCRKPVILRCFRDSIRVPGIENQVPTGPYRVPDIFLKKS